MSELAAALPKLSSCRKASLVTRVAGGFAPRTCVVSRAFGVVLQRWQGTSGLLARTKQADSRSIFKGGGQISRSVDSQNGVDTDAVAALLREARRVIIAARGALF